MASMRQASIVMSCVAEPKATSNANHATSARSATGSACAMPSSPAAITSCAASIQLRRLPSQRVSNGSATRSTTGAHSTLIE